MGCGSAMSRAISPRTRFCAPVGLKGSMRLICSRAWAESSKAMPVCLRAVARLSARPHSSQKNSSKIMRNWDGERNSLSSRRSSSGGGK